MTKLTAVAIALGVDPRAYLRSNGLERQVIEAAIYEANDRRNKEIEAIGTVCANALGRMFRKR